MGHMSKDRVYFKLSHYSVERSERLKKVMLMTLGFNERELINMTSDMEKYGQDYMTIICRPSQFARFLIKRNGAGIQNLFKELEPELVSVEMRPKFILDVSSNPYKG